MLVCELRFASMVSQSLHWTVTGPTSIQDHEFLGGLYELCNTSMDSVAERIVGLGGQAPTVAEQLKYAYGYAKHLHVVTLNDIMITLTHLTQVVNVISTQDISGGTANLIEGIADALEQQTFFLRQRLATQTPAH